MKRIMFCLAIMAMCHINYAQQKITDFSGASMVKVGSKNGVMTMDSPNPSLEGINMNKTCVKYNREGNVKYDNIKILVNGKLSDVSSYATYLGNPEKIKMKLYTTAPLGTKIEIQLGKLGDDNYPSGIHSQYEAVTSLQNVWEEISFNFSQIPKGSQVSAKEVDKITILFAPNSNSSDLFYFDELTIPSVIPASTTSENK